MLSSLSDMADAVNGPMLFITAVSVFFLVGITAAMIYFVLRYSRRRNPKADEGHGNTKLEIAWTVIPLLLALGMFWHGWVGYEYMKNPPDDAMRVTATGRMWSWSHEYENGITSPELNVPVGKPVRIDVESVDVIHSYYIPALKIKQDAVPGVEGLFLWFTPKEEGRYDVLCAEYCGLNHSAMVTHVNVMSESDFNAWYEGEQAKVATTKEVLEGSAEAGGEALVAVGKQLATTKGCIACHSEDGTVVIAPSFKGLYGKTETVTTDGQTRQVTVDDEYIRRSMVNPGADLVEGFQPLMPSQEGLVTDDEIAAIIEYIKSVE